MSNRKAARGGGKVAVSANVATGGAVENNDTKEANNDDVIMINNNKRELTLDSNKGEVQTAVIKEDFGKEEPRRRRDGKDELDPDEQAIVDLCNSCASCCLVF
jgi:hypothetical protein